jgi:hypothetical protein
MKKFLYWSILFCCQLLLLFLLLDAGWFLPIFANDQSGITYLLFCISQITIFSIGFKSYSQNNNKNMDSEWFASDAVLSLGLLGTVVGFMIMLGGTFANFETINHEMIPQIIQSMGAGLYTALNTTLLGIAYSLIIKTHLVIFESR